MNTKKSRLQSLVEGIKKSKEARERFETCGYAENISCNLYVCQARAGLCEYQLQMGSRRYCKIPLREEEVK